MRPYISTNLVSGAFVRCIKQLERAINQAQTKALREAAKAAYQSLKQTKSFRDRSGAGRRDFKYIPPKLTPDGMMSGITTGASAYTPFLNNGTGLYGPHQAKYPIYPVNAKVLRFKVRGGLTLFRPMVMHPGVRARHFMEDAQEVGEFVLNSSIEQFVNDAIEKVTG